MPPIKRASIFSRTTRKLPPIGCTRISPVLRFIRLRGLLCSNSPNAAPGYVAYGIITSARAYASGAANQAYAVAGYVKGTASQVGPYTATQLNLSKSISLMIDTDYDDTDYLADLIRARRFKHATPTGADLFWLDGTGRLMIAHGAHANGNPYTRARLHVAETAASDQFVETTTNTPRGIVNSQHNDGADDARLYFRKLLGTLTAPTAIQRNGVVLRLRRDHLSRHGIHRSRGRRYGRYDESADTDDLFNGNELLAERPDRTNADFK